VNERPSHRSDNHLNVFNPSVRLTISNPDICAPSTATGDQVCTSMWRGNCEKNIVSEVRGKAGMAENGMKFLGWVGLLRREQPVHKVHVSAAAKPFLILPQRFRRKFRHGKLIV